MFFWRQINIFIIIIIIKLAIHKKISNSLICSFLVSNLIEWLTVTLLSWVTWSKCSQLFFCHEQSVQFTLYCSVQLKQFCSHCSLKRGNEFFFEFFYVSSYRSALWDLIRKSKIVGQYLHTLPRYGNFNIFVFLTVKFYFPTNCFWNISTRSQVISEKRIFIFNSVSTVYSLFSTFCRKKTKIEQFRFFPLKAETQGFLYILIWIKKIVLKLTVL